MLRCPALTMSCKDKNEYSLHAGVSQEPSVPCSLLCLQIMLAI